MLIVNENSSEYFLKALEKAQKNNEKGYCLLFSSENYSISLESIIEKNSQILSEILIDQSLKFFMTEDKTGILWCKNITRKKAAQIFEIFFPNLKKHISPNKAFTIYDLTADIHSLLFIAQEKFDKILEQKRLIEEQYKKEQQEKIIQQERSILDYKITDEVKNQIKEKRLKREIPEILIVDDDIFSCKILMKLLDKNYSTQKAHTAWQAITSYITHAPDIVFLDIDMPFASGHDILLKIKEIDPEAYIIMLSGHSNQNNIVTSLKNGAAHFLTKPFAPEKIFLSLKKAFPLLSHKQKVKP